MEKKTLVDILHGKAKYMLETVTSQKGSFWSVSGGKKGSRHCGGGILVPDLAFLYSLCQLISQIKHLTIESEASETKIAFFSRASGMVCGEIKLFHDQHYYRVKRYANYFIKDNEIHYFSQHKLKPAGFGFFIQEFDFPISSDGIKVALEFSQEIQNAIEDYLVERIGNQEDQTLELLRNKQILVGGELPWLRTDMGLEKVIQNNSISIDLCNKLRNEPLSASELGIQLGLTPEAVKGLLNTSSRYDPEFFEQGFLLDRIHSGFDSLHYLITQIPKESLVESKTLACLLEQKPSGKWPDWIQTTFSNDEYSVGRSQSYHFALFEVEAFEGGLKCGVPPELSKLCALAIRLFDLKRHFQDNESMIHEINSLIDRFTSITKEIDHD